VELVIDKDIVLDRAIRSAILAASRRGEHRYERLLGVGVRAVRALNPDKTAPDALSDVRRLWGRPRRPPT